MFTMIRYEVKHCMLNVGRNIAAARCSIWRTAELKFKRSGSHKVKAKMCRRF